MMMIIIIIIIKHIKYKKKIISQKVRVRNYSLDDLV